MDNTLYVGLSHQMALRRHMDVVANNIANMNTTAFKREGVLFQEYLEKAGSGGPGMSEDTAFVLDYGVARNYTQGTLEKTGNPLDVAVTGRGFLAVSGEDGETFYTRNGHLQMDSDGRLVTPSGHAVLDTDDGEIVIADQQDITIASDGTITGDLGPIAQMQLVEFAPEDEQALSKVGDSLFAADAEPLPALEAQVLQGMTEGSNVEPIKEMTLMMSINRSYQQTAKILQQYQDMQKRSIEQLAKVS